MKALFSIISLITVLHSPCAVAQSLEPIRPIRINTVVTSDDFLSSEKNVAGAVSRVEDIVGLETRKTLYPGRPVLFEDLGPLTVIERNQLVELVFLHGKLRIRADGRAMGRASIGERVQVMNSDSRLTVTGIVRSPTSVEVQK